ncbi:MAG: hypothetical protein ACP5XB_11095 [Isosphaeraceae bacterium]
MTNDSERSECAACGNLHGRADFATREVGFCGLRRQTILCIPPVFPNRDDRQDLGHKVLVQKVKRIQGRAFCCRYNHWLAVENPGRELGSTKFGGIGGRGDLCECQMADGKWQMPDGKWQMPDGKWQMPDGGIQFRIAN